MLDDRITVNIGQPGSPRTKQYSSWEGSSMLEKVYRRNPDMVYREIAGELILVPIHHRAGEEDSIYVLNETGAMVWELADGIRTLDDIVSRMVDEFDVDRDTLEADLMVYIVEMAASGALEEA